MQEQHPGPRGRRTIGPEAAEPLAAGAGAAEPLDSELVMDKQAACAVHQRREETGQRCAPLPLLVRMFCAAVQVPGSPHRVSGLRPNALRGGARLGFEKARWSMNP
jgi:hypothetical protein